MGQLAGLAHVLRCQGGYHPSLPTPPGWKQVLGGLPTINFISINSCFSPNLDIEKLVRVTAWYLLAFLVHSEPKFAHFFKEKKYIYIDFFILIFMINSFVK